jgi:hypothetical protein
LLWDELNIPKGDLYAKKKNQDIWECFFEASVGEMNKNLKRGMATISLVDPALR